MALFTKVKSTKDRAILVSLLTHIVTGTRSSLGYAVAPVAAVKNLLKVEPQFVSIDGDPDAVGNVRVTANAAGLAAMPDANAPAAAAPTSAVAKENKTEFKLEDGIAIPEQKRGGGIKGETYPFTAMKPLQSFFVPTGTDGKNPAKSLASTVSSANKRFAATYPLTKGKNEDGTLKAHPKAGQSTGKDGREFTVRAVEGGARVFRTK